MDEGVDIFIIHTLSFAQVLNILKPTRKNQMDKPYCMILLDWPFIIRFTKNVYNFFRQGIRTEALVCAVGVKHFFDGFQIESVGGSMPACSRMKVWRKQMHENISIGLARTF